MTNFEYMRQKIADTVMLLDEMELLRLAEDTEMSAGGAEGIFNCTVCEAEYGECGDGPCTSVHNEKYLEWCKKEHTNKGHGGRRNERREKCIEISRQQMEYSRTDCKSDTGTPQLC